MNVKLVPGSRIRDPGTGLDGWMTCSFTSFINSISVISGRWAGCSDRLCASQGGPVSFTIEKYLRFKLNSKASSYPTELPGLLSGTMTKEPGNGNRELT